MRVEELLERYVREVAGQLPVRMRSDVSLELALLLREELRARAEALGREPDERVAVEVLQTFGHPQEVAARYHPRWAIIDPLDTRNFILTVVVGGALLVAASVPTRLLKPEEFRGSGEALVWWIGVSVLFFAIKSWLRHRKPEKRYWRHSHDPDRVSRPGMYAAIIGIAVTVAIFADPRGTFESLTGNPNLGSWLQYDPDFRAQRLPWLFGVWIAQAVMLAIVAVRGRWNPALRRASMVLSVALVVLFAWFRAGGPVMAEPAADETTKAFMAMFALFLLIDIGVRLYRQAGHVSDGKLRDALSS